MLTAFSSYTILDLNDGASVHFLNTGYSGTQLTLDAWGQSGKTDGWSISQISSSVSDVRVNDICWMRCTNTTKNGYTYVGLVVSTITQSLITSTTPLGIIDKGDQGDDPVFVVLTRDSAQVPANSFGVVPTGGYSEATTSLVIYKGTEVQANPPEPMFTYSPVNCDYDVDQNDPSTITVKDMTADTASITIGVTFEGVTYSKIFNVSKQREGASDIVGAGTYFTDDSSAESWFTTNYGGFREGCFYVNSSSYKILVYRNSDSSWHDLMTEDPSDDTYEKYASKVLPLAEHTCIDLYNDVSTSASDKETLWSLYDYQDVFVTKAVSTNKIQMTGFGVIASENISTNPAQDLDEKGYLNKVGYRLEGNSGTLLANKSYITDGNFVGGKFEGITVSGNSTFDGEINSDVLTTKLTTVPSSPVSAMVKGYSEQSGQVDYEIAPSAVSGAEVKYYLDKKIKNKLSVHTNYQWTSCSGHIFERSDFDTVMKISSASSTYSQLLSVEASDGTIDTDSSIYTNTFPCAIKVELEGNDNWCYASKFSTEEYWNKISGPTSEFGWDPPEQEPEPQNPIVDVTTWIVISDIKSVGNRYQWKETTYRYASRTISNDTRLYGEINVFKNGTKVATLKSYTLNPGDTIKLRLTGIDTSDYDDVTWHLGSARLKWKPSDNFKLGLLFLNGSTKKFYLSDMPDSIQTEDQYLDVGSDVDKRILDLVMNDDSDLTWSYSSTVGTESITIHPLYLFRWRAAPSHSGPTYSGSFNYFSTESGDTEISIRYPNTDSAVAITTLNSVSYTQDTIQIIGNNTAYLLEDTYLWDYTIKFTPISIPIGVYAGTILPKDKSDPTDSIQLGDSSKKWDKAYVKDLYADNVHAQASGSVTITPKGDVSKPSITVTKTNKNIQLSATLHLGSDNEYSILELGIVADVTPSEYQSVSTGVAVMSNATAELNSNPVFTGTTETIPVT